MKKTKKDYRIEGRPKTIYRVVKSAENPYVMIDRRPIDNATLSFKAKGILTYLMSRPDGWEVSVSDLINHATDGDDSIRSGLKELRDAGHMKYTKMRDKGRITGWLIEVYELPHADFPDVAFPDVENPTQVLKNLNSTERKKEKDRLIVVSRSFSNEVGAISNYWNEISEARPSKTLRAVIRRLFVIGADCSLPMGQLKSDIIGLVDRTFLQSPEYPENYMVTCLNTLQGTYEIYSNSSIASQNKRTAKSKASKNEPKGFEAGRKFLERHGIKQNDLLKK